MFTEPGGDKHETNLSRQTCFRHAGCRLWFRGCFSLGLCHNPRTDKKAGEAKELEAVAEVIYGGFDNDPFQEKTYINTANGKERLVLFPARRNGTISGVAIKTSTNKGFGGKMELIVGFFLDGTVSGYKVIHSNETPGLGTKVSEPRFKEQFAGIRPKKHLFKVKQDGGEIDAVTAATISSRAVIDAIQKAYDAYNKFSTGI